MKDRNIKNQKMADGGVLLSVDLLSPWPNVWGKTLSTTSLKRKIDKTHLKRN